MISHWPRWIKILLFITFIPFYYPITVIAMSFEVLRRGFFDELEEVNYHIKSVWCDVMKEDKNEK